MRYGILPILYNVKIKVPVVHTSRWAGSDRSGPAWLDTPDLPAKPMATERTQGSDKSPTTEEPCRYRPMDATVREHVEEHGSPAHENYAPEVDR